MQHLLNAWPALREDFSAKQKILLFVDYDGTLTPIVSNPEKAKLTPGRRRVLKQFAADPRFKVTIVSGRQIEDLREKVGIPQFTYAGNHGFEVRGPRLHYIHPGARTWTKLLQNIADDLKTRLSPIDGIQIENKILTLSVHYRNAASRDVPAAMQAFLNAVHPYTDRVATTEGKKVWEVRPAVLWDKGEMVSWLLEKSGKTSASSTAVIYLGDDQTDESAFRKLKSRGLTVRITDDPEMGTAAHYFLLSPDEVYEFFRKLHKLHAKKKRGETYGTARKSC